MSLALTHAMLCQRNLLSELHALEHWSAKVKASLCYVRNKLPRHRRMELAILDCEQTISAIRARLSVIAQEP